MAENTKIEWADHTFNPLGKRLRWRPELQPVGVDKPMTPLAQGNAIADIKSKFGMVGKASDVMRVQVSALIVAAMAAGKTVSSVNIIAPALKVSSGAQPAPLKALPVNVTGSIGAASGFCTGRGADLGPCLGGVGLTSSVAWSGLCRGAHFGAAFRRHLFALHRRNKGLAALNPSFADNFTSTERVIGHG